MFNACGVIFKSWRQLYRGLGLRGNAAPINDPIKLKAWLLVKTGSTDDQELASTLARLSATLNEAITLTPNDRIVIKGLLDGTQLDDLVELTGLDRNAAMVARAHLLALCDGGN